MAFSTQKDFFHVPFMNESVEYECKPACVKLKSYVSTVDDRAWSHDDTKKSKFVSDLVTCQTPVDKLHGRVQSDSAEIGDNLTNVLAQHGVEPNDSLLEVTTKNLHRIEQLFESEKSELQAQLNASNERLKAAREENETIKKVMGQKFDKDFCKDFLNKIQKLAATGKLNKTDESELLEVHHKIEDMYKAFELLQAVNSQLKRVLEKISRRTQLESIPVQPEISTDITFLQNQVNMLRKEVIFLRKLEDVKPKEHKNANRKVHTTDQDAEMLKKIVKERNDLREKCKSLKKLEMRVLDLQKLAKSANHMCECLTSDLDLQTNYIDNMEHEMQKMQNHYDTKLKKFKCKEEILKCQLSEMKETLIRCRCDAEKSENELIELASLRTALKHAEAKINESDCQYQQLMTVITELRGSSKQDLSEKKAPPCDEYLNELAFYTSITLEQIMQKFLKRGGKVIFKTNQEPKGKLIKDQKPKERAFECEPFKEDHKQKLDVLTNKMGQIDEEMNKNIKDTVALANDIHQTMQLVKDITDVQLQNLVLSTKVKDIKSREDQELLEDLRRQLDEEHNQNYFDVEKCCEECDAEKLIGHAIVDIIETDEQKTDDVDVAAEKATEEKTDANETSTGDAESAENRCITLDHSI